MNEKTSKFQPGDTVERVSGGNWFCLSEGDTAVVSEVIRTSFGWSHLKLEGYTGLFSDFRFVQAKGDADLPGKEVNDGPTV